MKSKTILLCLMLFGVQCVIVPPPWADVKSNPCAAEPKGWLMIYWPKDGKCYTIYKRGHPCPESMELTPEKVGNKIVATCKCPPGMAIFKDSALCYHLFSKGPCDIGNFFAPISDSFVNVGERRGLCTSKRKCRDETQVYWPADGRCYSRYTQGPCNIGTLIVEDQDGIGNCMCEDEGRMSAYYHRGKENRGCYTQYTRGPCQRTGEVFLPGGQCGCEAHEPQYHHETKSCYELGTRGPCPKGHVFVISGEKNVYTKAQCVCKDFHSLWDVDGSCYRLYTRGPCGVNEMWVGSHNGSCIKIPCDRGRLWVPELGRCYRAGDSTPCPYPLRLLFDFEARPSVDGLSFNGRCAPTKFQWSMEWQYNNRKDINKPCNSHSGHVSVDGVCRILYTRGPCRDAHWLIPYRNGTARCQCKHTLIDGQCKLPNQIIAEYLRNGTKQPMKPNQYINS